MNETEDIFTSEQRTKIRNLLAAYKMTHSRFEKILQSGILAYLFDPRADFSDREAIRAALRLSDANRPRVIHHDRPLRRSDIQESW